MRPGLYRLDVVVKDVNGDKTGIFSRSYTVPDYGDEKLSSSTLILADQMEASPGPRDRHRQFRDRHQQGPSQGAAC